MNIKNMLLGSAVIFSLASLQLFDAPFAEADEPVMCGDRVCAPLPGMGQGCCPFSDERLKQDIKPLQGSVDDLIRLHGVSYAYKIDKKKDIGLLAQDVQAVYPEIVHETDGYKRVDYEKLVAPLIEAIRELNQRLKMLEEKG
ncbi:hypothetical protein CWC48_14220 [Pseudomonas sp. S10E 269]|uniref:tail fiber domain-containing protein n=1 Tax=Pseudomonas TaxID=286 RepID=UPI000C2607B3|nr:MULTISPECIES: tail fiber domain-containing protein [Pseudomonas]MDR6165573.1 hypothetical protein [Pseudomonas fluorescens]PJK36304.1 hypothetical protein CWC49_24370 [Pseudomonas sp. S09F 262]PJK40249.1 hypothetical protein CWC48_14220 [Pseudomonas sp. S10E 269]